MVNWVKRTKICEATNGLLGLTKTDELVAKGKIDARKEGDGRSSSALRGSEPRLPTSETIRIKIKVWFGRFHIERVTKWR
jgi:hypothetical protein